VAAFTNYDKILIKILCLEKGYSAVQIMREFSVRNWSRSALCNLIKHIDRTATLIGQELIRRWDSERELFLQDRTCRGQCLRPL